MISASAIRVIWLSKSNRSMIFRTFSENPAMYLRRLLATNLLSFSLISFLKSNFDVLQKDSFAATSSGFSFFCTPWWVSSSSLSQTACRDGAMTASSRRSTVSGKMTSPYSRRTYGPRSLSATAQISAAIR